MSLWSSELTRNEYDTSNFGHVSSQHEGFVPMVDKNNDPFLSW